MDNLVPGRIVHYVMPSQEHRPAIVVHVWRVGSPQGVPTNNGMVNLTVFIDGRNDVVPNPEVNFSPSNNETLLMRCTSVIYSETHEPFTWHWIEREDAGHERTDTD